MSDDPKAQDAKVAEPTKPGEGDAARLAPREMTLSDHIFIWSMIILVGLIFGVGPSFGLIFASRQTIAAYNVDPVQVDYRRKTAQVLQQALNPNWNSQYGSAGEVWIQRDDEGYAREYRKAQLAKDRGLMPSTRDAEALIEDFYARKTFDGRTYLDRLRDDARGSEIGVDALRTLLAERFANDALDATLIIPPVLSQAATAANRSLGGTEFAIDQLTLTVQPLIEVVAEDDAELPRAYDRLINLDRFIVAPARVVSLAIADVEAVLPSVEAPDEAAIAAWYEAHRNDYAKPPANTPDVGQTLPPEFHPLSEVREQVITAIRRDRASKICATKAAALQALIVERDLEHGDADMFAKAVAESGLVLHTEVEIPEASQGDLDLGTFGALNGRSARDIGLTVGKPGEYVSDAQKMANGSWVVLRLTGRREAKRRTLEEPAVRDEVRAWVAERRAYPKLLAEAERIRALAEAKGPGGLRHVYADEKLAERWPAGVSRSSLDPSQTLTPPEPAEEGAPQGESRLAASIAIAGNPVIVTGVQGQGDVAQVRLVQCVGVTSPPPIDGQMRSRFLEMLRSYVARGQYHSAYQALVSELTE